MAIIIVISISCGVIFLYMYYLAHHDCIRHNIIYHPNIDKDSGDYNIFFIADIHRRTIKQETIANINEKIDIVCIGGDLMEKGVPLKRVRENITRLKQLHAPIYFVWGNNDEEVDKELLRNLLVAEGVIILEDQMVPVTKSGCYIQLACFRYEMYPNTEKSMIHWEKAAHDMTVLLTHKPSSFYMLNLEVKKYIDLVLAGHTHGGQIRLFGFGPYQRGSMKKFNDTSILITEGYGYSLLPLRLGTNAECHVIQLRHKEEKHSVQ